MYSVVIIDDNKIVAEAISKSTDWEKLGCRVTGTAYDGVTGLELIHNPVPDIVITDIQMPGFNGLDVAKKIQGIRKGIRFIVISGYSQFECAQQVIRYGVSDHLLKPILTEEMEQALKYVTDTLYKKEAGTAPGHMDGLEGRIYGIRSGKDGYSSMVSQAISYVDRNINHNISPRDVRDELSVFMSYFNKCFKKETGAGFSSYVTMVKMENARILFKNPKNRANEVAHMLGYSDHVYSLQVPKKQFDYAPNDIKLNVRKGGKRNDPNAGKQEKCAVCTRMHGRYCCKRQQALV